MLIGGEEVADSDVRTGIDYAVGLWLMLEAIKLRGGVEGLGRACFELFGVDDKFLKEKMPEVLNRAYGKK